MKQFIFIVFACVFATLAQAQNTTNKPNRPREIVLLAGLIQPLLLQGGNVEIEYYTPRMVFNYSHGLSLDLDRTHGTTVGAARTQSVALHLPYSTGFGVGYRLNRYVDVRFEPKLHRFDAYYDGSDRTLATNQIASYNTVTLGAGVYFRWKPFEKQPNALKGIFTSTSLRYWQNVWSSLEGNQLTYRNRLTNGTESHRAANIGIANTPILFNIAVGYGFTF